jgi:hypothetical protein
MIRPPDSDDQQGFARAIVALLEALAIPYAIGGSVAAMEYGEPRLSIDIDFMIDADEHGLAALIEAVEDWELSVTPLDAILTQYAPSGLPFNIIDASTGARADVYLVPADSGLAVAAMRRRQLRVWDAASGATAWFLSPEDVILFKLVYYVRGDQVAQKHPRDIGKMIAVSGETFDTEYIERWAVDLGVLELWRMLWSEDRGSPPSPNTT